MKQVASLRYGTIFKKAFSEKDIFTAFVRDVLGIEIEIEKVETEKSFQPSIGHVAIEFDLYAEDKKNRLIIDTRSVHKRNSDHYDRFFHYLCVALLEQVKTNYNYRPKLAVFSYLPAEISTKRMSQSLTVIRMIYREILWGRSHIK